MAFVIPEADLPLGDSLTAHRTNIPSCITYPAVEEGSAFEIKQHMLNILPTFHGLSFDDPNMHIAEFLIGCKNILVRGFSAESIKLRLFPYTLKDQARRWLLTLPSGSISTWAQLSKKILNKYYPASKTLDMRTHILSFAQKPNEEFHEAWERFKELIRKCPHSGINSTDQMHIFFRRLNMSTKTLVNASCGGSYKDKNAQEACLLFEKMAANTQQWAIEQPQSRSVFEMSNGSPYVSAQIEKMEKKLERFDAKFDMLLQRISGSQVALQQLLQAACSICSLTNHDFLSCPHKAAYPEFIAKQVQQPAAPKAAWEVAIEKLANTTTQEIQNLQAAMKNMEKQMGQIAVQVSERAPGEGELKPTSSIIQLADRSITYPRRVIEDVIVKVDNLYLPADFMVLDMDEDLTTPIILGRPFLATARTLIDVEAGTLTFRVEDQTVVFKLFEASIHSGDKQECMRVDVLNGLPHANFVTRSSTSKLPIKTQNVICHQVDQKHLNVKGNKKLRSSPSCAKIQPGKKVWMLSSDFKSSPGRQESRWKGPFLVTKVFNNGNVDIEPEGRGCLLKVKKYQLKPCIGKFGTSESLTLNEPVI
ncbi:unnamed protein product [Malus baccata var. baccata]